MLTRLSRPACWGQFELKSKEPYARQDEKEAMTETLTFLEYHKPALPAATYTLTIQQTLKTQKSAKVAAQTFMQSGQFAIQGAHYALDPSDISAVFPPAGSLGDHANTLPHIVFTRSTLPWERFSDVNEQNGQPWLMLLLLDESEQLGGIISKQTFLQSFPDPNGTTLWNYLLSTPVGWLQALPAADTALIMTSDTRAVQTLAAPYTASTAQVETLLNHWRGPQMLPLSALQQASSGTLNWPGWQQLEVGEQTNDLVTVIDVSSTLLAQLVPAGNELSLLAHVRQTTGAVAPNTDSTMAVLIGKRLPRKGAASTVYLVSLEHRYNGEQFNAPGAGLVRLISLQSWQFSCLAEEQQFTGLISNLDHNPGTLRLPPVGDPTAESAIATGKTMLPHHLRQGELTASFYHGPLVPGQLTMTLPLPARAADALLRYESYAGLFDTSYAAAWEIGRLLALQNKAFSTSLYIWKRSHAQELARQSQQTAYAYLPSQRQALLQTSASSIPDTLVTWLKNLSLLRGVPFTYLVPDARMLPAESLRFFRVDPLWISCLMDGAFSIGRTTPSDLTDDTAYDPYLAANPYPTVTGFLIRSTLVAGWPTLDIMASDQENFFTTDNPPGTPLQLLRQELLSSTVLLCLFAGDLQSVSMAEKAEMLHFGFDISTNQDQHLYKQLRDSQGHPITPPIDPLPWSNEAARSLNIARLAQDIASNCTSATFAYQMIEQAPKVIIKKNA